MTINKLHKAQEFFKNYEQVLISHKDLLVKLCRDHFYDGYHFPEFGEDMRIGPYILTCISYEEDYIIAIVHY